MLIERRAALTAKQSDPSEKNKRAYDYAKRKVFIKRKQIELWTQRVKEIQGESNGGPTE